jgi:hypothetical protein
MNMKKNFSSLIKLIYLNIVLFFIFFFLNLMILRLRKTFWIKYISLNISKKKKKERENLDFEKVK